MSKHVVAGPHAGALRTMYVVDSTAGPFAAQVVNKRRSAFSAYLFQVIGDNELLYNFIKYPISSAAQPALLREALQICNKHHTCCATAVRGH